MTQSPEVVRASIYHDILKKPQYDKCKCGMIKPKRDSLCRHCWEKRRG